MKKKFYSIEEALNILEQKISIEDLCSYTRENMIHPVIYINSFPMHACECHDNQAIFVGFCFLSGYWDVGDNIIAMLDTIARGQHITTKSPIKKDLVQSLRIMNWQHDLKDFNGVPEGHINPKQYSEGLPIEYFFIHGNPFIINIKNVFINHNDLEILKSQIKNNSFYSKSSLLTQNNKNTSEKQTGIIKRTNIRSHPLRELVQKIYDDSPSEQKNAASIWKKLKEYKEIIIKIDTFSYPDATIEWISTSNRTLTTKRKTFVNWISKLKTGKRLII